MVAERPPPRHGGGTRGPSPAFDEHTVREAVLNALTHRDYRHNGSVIVR
ncbi:MAG TPA: hypothetical protein VNO22_12555 [Planctomycetota bacterium]|nr:hypothetical protein [Planctomycetota bacterium]